MLIQGITLAIYCFPQFINVAFFFHFYFLRLWKYLEISYPYNTVMNKVYLTTLTEVTTASTNNI